MKKELLGTLLLLGCADDSVRVEQQVHMDYQNQTYQVETILWVPSSSWSGEGMEPAKKLEADSLREDQVDSVKTAQRDAIEPLYQKVLEFHRSKK